jgi:tubulin monoglycylase TTLL3/8
MVDTKLNVWLLEVNSSPSMKFSTPITEKLVKQLMPEMTDIIWTTTTEMKEPTK